VSAVCFGGIELTNSAPQALVHEFFDELRVEGVKLPNGHDMPALFNFTKEGESCKVINW
jgi:hypothetical protein